MVKVTFSGSVDDFRPYIFCTLVNPENGKLKRVKALVDTGATDCSIREDLFEELELEKGENKPVTNPGFSGVAPSTVMKVVFEGPDESGRAVTVTIKQVQTLVQEFDDTTEMLMGVNVLREFDLAMKRGGIPSLTWDRPD